LHSWTRAFVVLPCLPDVPGTPHRARRPASRWSSSFSALPRLAESDEASAQGFVEQVATTLRWAQKTAVAQRRVVYVNLDAGTGRVRACLDAGNACAQPVAAPATGALDVAAPARVALTSAVTQFSFDGLGRPSLAANLEIRGTTSRGEAFAIVVERDSGYVRRL
jgi:MSHA pilin protein MshC